MGRSPSSDAPDQRATEIMRTADPRWIEFSSGDFESAASEDFTVAGGLVPKATADEIALLEVVDVLGRALERQHHRPAKAQPKSLRRWIAAVVIACGAAAIPHEWIDVAADNASGWIASMMAE
jgi:hypothetical protein